MLRLFVENIPRTRHIYRAHSLLGNEEITVCRYDGWVGINCEIGVIEPDGSRVTVSTDFAIKSFTAPVVREVTCIRDEEDTENESLPESPEALSPAGRRTSLRSFPAALIYADAADIQELLHKLGTWEQVDA